MKEMRGNKRKVQGLQDLCKCLPSEITGLEIGSFAGESAQIFIESGRFEKIYCVDPWSSKQTEKYGAEERFDAVAAKYIQIVKCKGRLIDWALEIGKVDFVYIDGNHDYLTVVKDIFQSCLLLKVPGFLAGHDYGSKTDNGVPCAVGMMFPDFPVQTFKDSSFLIRLDKSHWLM